MSFFHYEKENNILLKTLREEESYKDLLQLFLKHEDVCSFSPFLFFIKNS